MKKYLSLIRLSQWSKNLLIFIPIVAAKKYEIIYFQNGLFGFVIFSLLASSIYIFNDIIDFDKDKKHPTKKYRSLVSGKISKNKAIILGIIFLSLSILFGYDYNLLPIIFFYILLNILYSFFLKKFKFLDIFTLSFFYITRIVFGGKILNLEISYYLYIFSFFIFFSLAGIKRLNELQKYTYQLNVYEKNNSKNLLIIILISNLICVISLIGYLISEKAQIIYNNNIIICLTVPIITMWILLITKNAYQGKIQDDPIEFTLTNKTSLLLIILAIAIAITTQFFKHIKFL